LGCAELPRSDESDLLEIARRLKNKGLEGCSTHFWLFLRSGSHVALASATARLSFLRPWIPHALRW
jgi:hypothetical protein